MLPRQQRLRRSEDIRTVFRTGQRTRHRLAMLVYRPRPDAETDTRFCFVASKKVGNAVQRNRAKRLLREAVRAHINTIRPGWDCVLMANYPMPTATQNEVEAAIQTLLRNAGLCVVAT